MEDARKAADEHRDSAERDASVRLQEAEAVYEEQRARAAKAAADFETTLAGRRSAAEDEFTQKMGEAQGRLDEMSDLAERTRLDAEGTRAQAAKEAGRLTEDAHEAAAQIISEAKATAERIRSDSERELAAATQRRDSINSQLANVRQMLATLTGTAPFSLTGLADAPDEAWVGSDEEPGRPTTVSLTVEPNEATAAQESERAGRRRARRRGGRGERGRPRPQLTLSRAGGPVVALALTGRACQPAFPFEPAECRLVPCRSRPRPSSCSVPPATWPGASCCPGCSTSSRPGLMRDVTVVGTSLDEHDRDSFIEFAHQAVTEFGGDDGDTDGWSEFAKLLHWSPGEAGPRACVAPSRRPRASRTGEFERLHYLSRAAEGRAVGGRTS